MTTKSDQYSAKIDLDAKYLGDNEQLVDVLIMPQAKRVQILKTQEFLEEWKDATLGDMIRVRVSQSLAGQKDLIGGTTNSSYKGGNSKPLNG